MNAKRLTLINGLLCFVLGLFVALQVNRPAEAYVRHGFTTAVSSPITSADTVDLSSTDYVPPAPATSTRSIFVGTAGDITMLLVDDTVPVTYHNVPVGRMGGIYAQRIYKTGTTASQLMAEY